MSSDVTLQQNSSFRRVSPSTREQAKAEKLKRKANREADWPEQYTNSDTEKIYKPHHEDEAQFVYSDEPRHALAKGGEGGGKSVAGIVKCLNRIKRGMSGIMVSPDLPHFKRSLWPEFRRWCPWDQVVKKQRYRGSFTWEPHSSFTLSFINGTMLVCGGIDEPGAWEGPNVNFAFFDEARRKKKADALKVLDGRVRIAGPNGEPPQLFVTTTPRKHWLFEYYGPLHENDERADFKAETNVITLYTRDNVDNLAPGYLEMRRLSLTEAEARVLLEAEWEDIEDTQRFLPSMTLWDLCEGKLPALGKEPMVLAMDAAIGGTGKTSSFGVVGVTRHPKRHDDVAARYVQKWKARPGRKIDFGAEDGPEQAIRGLCKDFNVVCVCYDPYQLHDMATRLNKENVAWFFEFSQGQRRLEADRQLYDLILQRRLVHNGNVELREHVSNANRKLSSDDRRLRIVKRELGMNVDLAVCLSMAAYENLRLNL